MKLYLILISGPMFLISMGSYIFVKLTMRPDSDSGVDDYYYEFEEMHPGLARYNKWSHITFTAAVISALVVFIGVCI